MNASTFTRLLATCALASASFGASAQVLAPEDLKGDIVVHVQAFVGKGEGCTQVTKKAGKPLSHEDCLLLLSYHGRNPWVDRRNSMMQVIMDPKVYRYDSFMYVSVGEKKGWVLVPHSD